MLKLRFDKSFSINLAAGIILCFSLINGAIGINGISLITLVAIILLLLISVNPKSIFLYSGISLIIIGVIFIFVLSLIFVRSNDYTKEYFMYFIGFCIISMIVGLNDFNIEKVLKNCSLIGLICVLVMLFIRGIGNYSASLQMGITYSMLPVLMSSYILIRYFRTCIVISSINIVLILYSYIRVAPRGVWIVIGIFIVFSIFFSVIKDDSNWKRTMKIALLLTITISALLYISNNLFNILTFINDVYQDITGNRVYAINKYLFFLNKGDISNGRDYLWDLAVESIKESLIIGHGIGYYESIAGGYTHNIILQSLCEAGVIFFLPIVSYIILCLKTMMILIKTDKAEFAFYNMLFANGIVILFFSSVYWKLYIFWFLLGYTICLRNRKDILYILRGKKGEIFN